jgi:predicted ATPase
MRPPYVTHAAIAPERPLDPATFPGKLPFTRDLSLEFDSAVTFFVGENGSGKSTLLEAMAVVARLPIFGGGMNELGLELGLQEQSLLAESLRLSFTRQPKDRYFFRAETQAYFAQLLDQRRHDADFNGDPYKRYGGKPLHEISHGEAFLGVMTSRFQSGLFFLDEPESALSPTSIAPAGADARPGQPGRNAILHRDTLTDPADLPRGNGLVV